MADTVTTNPGVGGASLHMPKEVTTGVYWPSTVAYITGGVADAWTLQVVDATHGLPVSVVGTVQVSALPAGLATDANQATEIVSLASIDGKLPALGQALAAASVPVVLTAAQLSSLTVPVLGVGSAIVGKVGIDQTTDGTTNAVRNLTGLGSASVATLLFSATVAGSATLSKTRWPSTYAGSLPSVGSGISGFTALTETGATVGGVFSPAAGWGGVLLDFAGVGSADLTCIVEIGKVAATGCMPQVIATVSLKSITTGGTFTANFNPFTGAAVSSTTYRLFDLATITTRSSLGAVLTNLGGTEDNTPCQLLLNVDDSPYYFILVTTLGLAGPVICCLTPVP